MRQRGRTHVDADVAAWPSRSPSPPRRGAPTLAAFIDGLGAPDAPLRVPGVAVYLRGQREMVPLALSLNLRRESGAAACAYRARAAHTRDGTRRRSLIEHGPAAVGRQANSTQPYSTSRILSFAIGSRTDAQHASGREMESDIG